MYLGIDIGTSSVKAVLVDDKDTVVEQASAPLNVSRPQAGWSEQNPADWWSATNAAVKALPAPLRKAVKAVGLSGQMHGATLLDAADKPLRPAILWNDGRSEKQCATLEKAEPRTREITGNIAMPGFTAPKLVWVRENEPAVFKDTRCVLLPKDYVRLLMTGEKASDASDAAGTLWLDVAQAPLVARDAGRHGPHRIAHAEARRRLRRHRLAAQGSCRRLGHGRGAGRRRRWRQCRRCRGHWRHQAGRCLPVAGHLGRACSWSRRNSCRIPPRPCMRSATACPACGTR